jgi:hypothetical protein
MGEAVLGPASDSAAMWIKMLRASLLLSLAFKVPATFVELSDMSMRPMSSEMAGRGWGLSRTRLLSAWRRSYQTRFSKFYTYL